MIAAATKPQTSIFERRASDVMRPNCRYFNQPSAPVAPGDGGRRWVGRGTRRARNRRMSRGWGQAEWRRPALVTVGTRSVWDCVTSS